MARKTIEQSLCLSLSSWQNNSILFPLGQIDYTSLSSHYHHAFAPLMSTMVVLHHPLHLCDQWLVLFLSLLLTTISEDSDIHPLRVELKLSIREGSNIWCVDPNWVTHSWVIDCSRSLRFACLAFNSLFSSSPLRSHGHSCGSLGYQPVLDEPLVIARLNSG